MKSSSNRMGAAVAMALTIASMAVVPADARRGGSFGSRGSRTYYAPRSTYGASRPVAPIDRSMTQRPQSSPSYNPGFGQPSARPVGGRFGGFGGGLLGGLVAGGLLGHFLGGGMGGGWGSGGGGGGFLASLIQLAILGGIVWLVIGFFRRRSGAQSGLPQDRFGGANGFVPQAGGSPWGGNAAPAAPYAADTSDIPLDQSDQDAFERLLIDVQDAFGREDYTRLRSLTTPEIMSYLSEELSQNATQGVRNEVSGTRLLDAEVSEAWREGDTDYATIALRYEGIDVMRNRSTGAIVSGSATMPSETTELWTFIRDRSGIWKLSAIQES